jgi:hypothetical protein
LHSHRLGYLLTGRCSSTTSSPVTVHLQSCYGAQALAPLSAPLASLRDRPMVGRPWTCPCAAESQALAGRIHDLQEFATNPHNRRHSLAGRRRHQGKSFLMVALKSIACSLHNFTLKRYRSDQSGIARTCSAMAPHRKQPVGDLSASVAITLSGEPRFPSLREV